MIRILTVAVLLCLSVASAAQQGPGGVGTSTGNVLWLRADNGVYTNTGGTIPAVNGDPVGRWDDQSGNNRHASHGTVTERPNLITNVVNGLPVLRFVAADGDRLLSTGVAGGNAASVWAVARWSTLPSSNPGIIQASPAGLSFSGGASDKVIGMWVSNASGVWGRGVQSNGTQANLPENFTTSVNTFYAFLNRYDGSATIEQYVNNNSVGSVNYDGTLRSWSDFGIGRQANEGWNGDIAEVIAFNFAVNTAQRIIVNNYLAAKYGFTLLSNDVYTMDNAGNGHYDHEVAGIGRANATNIHNDAKGSGIVRVSNPSGLGNNEYFMWGHDNGALQTTVTTGLPAGVTARFARQWRVSETADVGAIDMDFYLDGLADFSSGDECSIAQSLRLLVDTDNDGYADETPISGAVSLGNNVYRFTGVTAIGDTHRFTLGVATVDPVDGPGGVGNTEGSSSLKLWFRPDHGVNTTGSSVDSWANSAGLAVLNISETGTQRPQLVTNAVNGFSEVSFNGSNRLRTGLTLTTSNFITNEAFSFLVVRADNTTQQSCVYLTDPLETNRFSNHIPWAGSVYFDIGNCCGSDTRLEVGGLTGLTNYSVWSYDANPSSGKQLYRNGNQIANVASTSTYSSHATHRFNIGGNTDGSGGFVGDVAEVIIFNSRVNSAQRVIIQNYLAAKYGLSLAADDIYQMDNPGNGNFDFDVAGIGRVNSTNIHAAARGGIVTVSNPSNLGDNEFLIWGHNNGSLGVTSTTDLPPGIEGKLSRIWRVSEVNVSGSAVNVGDIDLEFDLSGQGPITPADLRLLIDHDNDGIFGEPGTIQLPVTSSSIGCGLYMFRVPGGDLANNRRFTIGTANIIQTPLPIELTSLTGQMEDGNARVSWTTQTETNNHFFSVERSTDGKNFRVVGDVEGSGTTSMPVSYEFIDQLPPIGILYYRLRQVDYDGAYSYSDVIRVDNTVGGTQLIATPNPVTGAGAMMLRIRHREMVDMRSVYVRVLDVVGREVMLPMTPEEQSITLSFAGQGSGVYLISVFSSQLGEPLTIRVLVSGD